MTYCDDCGFYMSDDDCDMCESDLATIDSQPDASPDSEQSKSGRPISTWWRYIALAPFLMFAFYYFAAQNGQVPSIAYLMTILIYSFAIILDVRYVRKWTTGWMPNSLIWAALAALNVVLGGVLTFIITPLYLYKRQEVVPRDEKPPELEDAEYPEQ